MDDEMAKRGAEARCGLIVVDLETGDAAYWLRLEGAVQELYDVTTLPDVQRPKALGFQTDEIQHTTTAQVDGCTCVWSGLPK